jgi:hypothetical protein
MSSFGKRAISSITTFDPMDSVGRQSVDEAPLQDLRISVLAPSLRASTIRHLHRYLSALGYNIVADGRLKKVGTNYEEIQTELKCDAWCRKR